MGCEDTLYSTVNINPESEQVIVNRPYTTNLNDFKKITNNQYFKLKCKQLKINMNKVLKIDDLNVLMLFYPN